MKETKMENKIKRFLSLVLAVVMIVGMVPMNAFATGTDGNEAGLPAATVTELTGEEAKEGVAFCVNFKADALSDEQLEYYGSWNVDLVLTPNRALTMNNSYPSKYSYLSVKCPEMSDIADWTDLPGDLEKNVEIAAKESWSLMTYFGTDLPLAAFMQLSSGVSYAAVFQDAYLEATPGLKATVALVLTDPETEEQVTIAEYEYESPVKAPELPEATVTQIFDDELTFAMKFKAEEVTEEQLAYYGSWYADFELTINKDVTFNANGGADGWLSGRYDAWENGAWVNVPIEEVELEANETLKIMEFASKLLSKEGLKMTYAEILSSVQEFDCGVFFTEEFLEANPDLEVKLELRVYNPVDESETYTVGEPHTFTKDDVQPDLPTATVKELLSEDLTFAMNFKAKEITEEQLAYYGEWYADFELTVNKDVTFNANGGADGYLSGRYDSWENGAWVNVPFKEAVSLEAGKSLKIMETAAEQMGDSGLQVVCKEIYENVKDFDCGVFFTEEFLEANPDLEVKLELRMYNPKDPAESYVIGDTYFFEVADIRPNLPTATVKELLTEDLTFGMNFVADEVTEEQLEYYGEWYADFELTVNKDVTFDANGGADGYLSGSYDAWENGAWVNVPFKEAVSLEAGKSLKIMETAAEQMGEAGLQVTYNDIVTSVKDFDCGAFFEPAFLEANPDLEVTLELRMYNPEDLAESYVIGETYVFTLDNAKPNLPTATVKELLTEDLTFAMNFVADEVTEEQLAYYGDWHADFELTVNKDVTFDANGGADGYLSGSYDAWENGAWVNVPFKEAVSLEAGKSLKIMETAAEQMGEAGLQVTYNDIVTSVKDFDCGAFFEPAFLEANPDLEVTLELRMYNPDDETESYTIGDTYVFTLDNAKPNLPTATVTEIENDDLTFAMNFKADEVTEEQLAYYDKWYTDFELTVNKDVTFYTGDGADGYLSGQYDGWSENWVNVPYNKAVSMKAGESLKIMATAAELMGESGLKYTYGEVYEIVKDFDCGVYFAPEFLVANPDLEVKLELKMYNPDDESESYGIGQTYIFTLEQYVAYNVQQEKLYTKVSDGMLEAAEGETVQVIRNTSDRIVNVLNNTTLDLNGYTLETDYMFCVGDVVDNSESNGGLLKTDYIMIREDNAQLPVKVAEGGYKFFELLKYNKKFKATDIEGAEKYIFQTLFEPAAHEYLMAGKEVTGVSFQVRVSWTTGEDTRSQDFEYGDQTVNNVLGSYNASTGKYGRQFTLTLLNAANYEDLSYQIRVVSDTGVVAAAEADASEKSASNDNDSVTKEETTVTNEDGTAVVPAGTKLDGTELSLNVSEMENGENNVTLSENEEMTVVDVHVTGVAADNTVPILITLTEFLETGLNKGNLTLYHVENGVTNAMTQVYTLAEVDAHNEFYYDPATGDVTMALATFSEIASVFDTAKPWEGIVDYSWYDSTKTELTISNADQLAAFSAIVGGMAEGIAQDSFAGKTVKLIADINLNDAEASNTDKIFHPIGYYYTDDSNADGTTGDYYSTVYSFEGTFDGNGHTIANFYQNTWEIKGDYDGNYYKDAMGLFGYVLNGRVENLTVDNFSSDGEFTPTGVIAAYAVNSAFENIAITNCNPRVYNTGNGGIVGIGGDEDDDTVSSKLTFTNITIDNSNKISALWGSWDVACGGLIGMFRGVGKVDMTNCHVAAQIDVNNDVCGNYQYYWYRYSGMLIGTNTNMITDDNGYTVPETDKFTAQGCTVHFGDWNDYYYCELVANSIASYTHDHQFSRLVEVSAVNGTTITYLDGTTGTVPTSGRYNYVVVNGTEATENASCYHFVDGAVWNHEDAGTEEVNGETVLKEDNQHIYLPFNQLFTGYGWGVKHIPIYDDGSKNVFAGVEILGRDVADSVVKFAIADGVKDVYSNAESITVGELFKDAGSDVAIANANVQVFVSPLGDRSNVSGVYTPNTTDWTQGTLTLTGEGMAAVYITDYNYCKTTMLTIRVVGPYAKLEFDSTQEVGYAGKGSGFLGLTTYQRYIPVVSNLKITDYQLNANGTGYDEVVRFDGSNKAQSTDLIKTASVSASATNATILITLLDGGQIVIELNNDSASSKLYTMNDVLYFMSGTTSYSISNEWTVNSYSFVGYNAETVASESRTFTCSAADAKPTEPYGETLTYAVTFELNDGSGRSQKSYVTDKTTTLTLPEVASRDGYTFTGWYTAEGTRVGGAGDTYTPTANITLYGRWIPDTNITYVAEGGSCDVSSAEYRGEAVILPTATTTQTGKEFDGWYTADGTRVGSAGDSYTPDTANQQAVASVTLYAHWKMIDYTITYPSSGGLFATIESIDGPATAHYGDTVTVNVTFQSTPDGDAVITGDSGTEYAITPSGSGKNWTYTFTMPAENVTLGVEGSFDITECVTPETLITLADGSQVRVDSLTGDEELLVWNLETGALDSAPILFIDSDPEREYEIIHLYFSDGTDVKVISEHGFWDYDLNEYVYLDANAADYIGHTFAKQNGDELTKVKLTDVVIETEVTTAWSPVTAGHLCYFVNGMLSMPGGVAGLFNIFEVDPETMAYDPEAMARDIETYGLYTYEEMNEIVPLPEAMFEAAGGAYLKVSIGKGNMTVDDLIYMVHRYRAFFE